MNHTIQDILEFIKEHDVKFIRLAFCDVFGNQKNISVMSKHIADVLENGIIVNSQGIDLSYDNDYPDILLIPDLSTFDILPWRPQTGSVIRFFCQICTVDKKVLETDCRSLLMKQLIILKDQGYQVIGGTKCQFYLFYKDENGQSTWIPNDKAGYLDIAPNDKGEDIRREICLTLEEMGITTKCSHHEHGPGQNGIEIESTSALNSCDQLTTFKWATQTIADIYDLHACFLPKPLPQNYGSGLSIRLSLNYQNKKLFSLDNSEVLAHFIGGIQNHIQELILFLNPHRNSYERLEKDFKKAPFHPVNQFDSQLLRVLSDQNDISLNLLFPDSQCNPYLAFALLIGAGMDGIERKLQMVDQNSDFELPTTMAEAIRFVEESEFIKTILPTSLISHYIDSAKKNL